MMVGSFRKLNPLFNDSRVADLDLRIDPKLRRLDRLQLQTLSLISEPSNALMVSNPVGSSARYWRLRSRALVSNWPLPAFLSTLTTHNMTVLPEGIWGGLGRQSLYCSSDRMSA